MSLCPPRKTTGFSQVKGSPEGPEAEGLSVRAALGGSSSHGVEGRKIPYHPDTTGWSLDPKMIFGVDLGKYTISMDIHGLSMIVCNILVRKVSCQRNLLQVFWTLKPHKPIQLCSELHQTDPAAHGTSVAAVLGWVYLASDPEKFALKHGESSKKVSNISLDSLIRHQQIS